MNVEFATRALISFDTLSPWFLFSPSKKPSKPVSLNTASTMTLLPTVIEKLSFGSGILALIPLRFWDKFSLSLPASNVEGP